MKEYAKALNWTVAALTVLVAALLASIHFKGSYIGGINLFIIGWVGIYTAIIIFIFISYLYLSLLYHKDLK